MLAILLNVTRILVDATTSLGIQTDVIANRLVLRSCKLVGRNVIRWKPCCISPDVRKTTRNKWYNSANGRVSDVKPDMAVLLNDVGRILVNKRAYGN